MRNIIIPAAISIVTGFACTGSHTTSDVGYVGEAEGVSSQPGPLYSILSEEAIPGTKRSVDVLLQKKVTESALESIAHDIRSRASQEYDRTFVLYYLPGMEVGAGAWATSHFNPALEVRILGLSTADEGRMATSPPGLGDVTIIGCWLDESPFAGGRIALLEAGGQLYMDRTFKDGSGMKTRVVEGQSALGRRFDPVESSHGDYWILDNQGGLQVRDGEGLIATAKKLADCD